MSFNNGPYIFSDVPGYESSKGERIVKAFRKLWAKISHLEQAKILEKNTLSQEVQTSNDTDITISDIKYDLLLTQLRYIIKIVREYANDGSSNPEDKDCRDATDNSKLASSSNNYTRNHKVPGEQHHRVFKENKPSSVSKVRITERVGHQRENVTHQAREEYATDHQVSTTGTQTSFRIKASEASEKLPQDHSKPNSQSHYHLKLNDVPFILGASSSASHSVVANVQNIIALMKSHNKALCAPKPQSHREASSANMHKTDTQDANKMLQKLSEDLSKLTLKQERLKAMLDNAQTNPHSSDEKVKASQHFDCVTSNDVDDAGQRASTGALQKNTKQSGRKKSAANFGKQEKHIIPTVRMQSNDNPQLARRKILRSLKDFKTHLSEEDLSWK